MKLEERVENGQDIVSYVQGKVEDSRSERIKNIFTSKYKKLHKNISDIKSTINHGSYFRKKYHDYVSFLF